MKVSLRGLANNIKRAMGRNDKFGWGSTLDDLVSHVESLEQQLDDSQWWLGEIDQHGVAYQVDGPHSDRAGVEKAAYLIRSLGMQQDRKFACLRISQTPIEANPHGVNEDALRTCRRVIGGRDAT